MLNMTTLELSQTKKNTDWLHLEHILEMQVSKAAAPLTRITSGILTGILVRITACGACCVETKHIIQSVITAGIPMGITVRMPAVILV